MAARIGLYTFKLMRVSENIFETYLLQNKNSSDASTKLNEKTKEDTDVLEKLFNTKELEYDKFLTEILSNEKIRVNSLIDALKEEFNPNIGVIIDGRVYSIANRFVTRTSNKEDKEKLINKFKEFKEFVVKNIIKRLIMYVLEHSVNQDINNELGKVTEKVFTENVKKNLLKPVQILINATENFIEKFSNYVPAEITSKNFINIRNKFENREIIKLFEEIHGVLTYNLTKIETNLYNIIDQINDNKTLKDIKFNYKNYLKYKYNINFGILHVALHSMFESLIFFGTNPVKNISSERILEKCREDVLVNAKLLQKQFEKIADFIEKLDNINVKKNMKEDIYIEKINRFLNRLTNDKNVNMNTNFSL